MSDHTPVICLIDADIVDRIVNKSPDFSRANWKAYEEHLNNVIDLNADFNSSTTTKDSINAAINKLTNDILEAKLRAVPFTIRKSKTFDISSMTKSFICTRNILKRKWKRCRHPVLKKSLKKLFNLTNKQIEKEVTSDRKKIGLKCYPNFEQVDKHSDA
jgi:hypothetical protein